MLTIFPKSETYMRAGCKSGAAYISNHVSLFDRDTGFDACSKARHVQVLSCENAVVFDFYKFSIAPTTGSFQDRPIPYCQNRRTTWSCIIHAQVSAISLQYRMKATTAKAGTDSGIFQRRFQESFSQAVSLFIKVVRFAILLIQNCVKGFAPMAEGCSFYLGNPDGFSFYKLLFIYYFEIIALLQIEKIDRPGINIFQYIRETGVNLIINDRFIQRRTDQPRGFLFYFGNGFLPCINVNFLCSHIKYDKIGATFFVNEIVHITIFIVHENCKGISHAHLTYIKNLTIACYLIDHLIFHIMRSQYISQKLITLYFGLHDLHITHFDAVLLLRESFHRRSGDQIPS